MCIFSRPIISVDSTQIFARATSQGTQFLAYQLNYESPDENAMILPLPVRQPVRDDSLRFIDLKSYGTLFHDLAQGFPYSRSSGIACAAPHKSVSGRNLKVFEVGNYVASFVPTLADFSRLDARFSLPEAVWAQVPQYKNFGFAMFQLAAGSLKPHPMAFEFETATEKIYFPTLHIHDGEIHKTEEFDHILYLQHAGFDSRVYGYKNSNISDPSTGLVRSKHAAGQFCDIARSSGLVSGDLLVHRQIIQGNHPNQDTEIVTSGDPTNRTLNLRPYLTYTPWAFAAAVTMWFFARRARIKRNRTAVDASDG